MYVKQVINNIKECRKQKNMSQEELAERAGLSKNYISELERYEKSPSLETFIKLINALEISADVILQENGQDAEKIGAQCAHSLTFTLRNACPNSENLRLCQG